VRWAPEGADRVDPSNGIAGGNGSFGGVERMDGVRVAEHFDCLFEAGEIVRADHHDGRAAVAGYDDSLMLTFNAIDVLGEAVLHGSQRLSAHGYNCATTTRQ
jgi:hypothetical protein